MTDESHDPWTILSERRAYENPWLAVDHREVLTPRGAAGVYGIVRFKKVAVGVVPLEPDGTIHLVGQWRVPLGRYSWEIPEGGAEPGEDPAACARREMEEEIGIRAGHLTEILRLDLSNSCTDETAVIFLATGLTLGEAAPDETELLAHKRLPFADAFAQAVGGAITDAMTVAGLLRAYHMAKTGQFDAPLGKAMLKGIE